MKIRYLTRSEFFSRIEKILRENLQSLMKGSTIFIHLKAGGYKGSAMILISEMDKEFFKAEWLGSDPSRFPSRLNAAATILFRNSIFGNFLISHSSGCLSIKKE